MIKKVNIKKGKSDLGEQPKLFNDVMFVKYRDVINVMGQTDLSSNILN